MTLTRHTPLRRKRPTPRRRRPIDAIAGCSYTDCRVAGTVEIHEDERYCREHAEWVADKLAREHVLSRDHRTCLCCGAKWALEWAHIIGRGARYIKWEPENAVTLCHGCHEHFTGHRALFTAWIAEKFGPSRYDRLMSLEAAGERQGDSVDLAAVIRGFREVRLTPAEIQRYRSGAWLG